MAATHAEILVSLLDYLNYLDDHFGSLVKSNRAQIAKSNARISETFAHMRAANEG